MHPGLKVLLIASIIVGGRFALDAYNESASEEVCETYGPGTAPYCRHVPGERAVPTPIAVGGPYVAGAAIGYFLIAIPPFGLAIGVAAAMVFSLAFLDGW